ncbi:hypothetical protein LC55x_3078 [Lysobacter capsici]|nr:hypothetical protein LC55x_3078 [Lysobacter capsici]
MTVLENREENGCAVADAAKRAVAVVSQLIGYTVAMVSQATGYTAESHWMFGFAEVTRSPRSRE